MTTGGAKKARESELECEMSFTNKQVHFLSSTLSKHIASLLPVYNTKPHSPFIFEWGLLSFKK